MMTDLQLMLSGFASGLGFGAVVRLAVIALTWGRG
jgi:hypothetical protein